MDSKLENLLAAPLTLPIESVAPTKRLSSSKGTKRGRKRSKKLTESDEDDEESTISGALSPDASTRAPPSTPGGQSYNFLTPTSASQISGPYFNSPSDSTSPRHQFSPMAGGNNMGYLSNSGGIQTQSGMVSMDYRAGTNSSSNALLYHHQTNGYYQVDNTPVNTTGLQHIHNSHQNGTSGYLHAASHHHLHNNISAGYHPMGFNNYSNSVSTGVANSAHNTPTNMGNKLQQHPQSSYSYMSDPQSHHHLYRHSGSQSLQQQQHHPRFSSVYGVNGNMYGDYNHTQPQYGNSQNSNIINNHYVYNTKNGIRSSMNPPPSSATTTNISPSSYQNSFQLSEQHLQQQVPNNNTNNNINSGNKSSASELTSPSPLPLPLINLPKMDNNNTFKNNFSMITTATSAAVNTLAKFAAVDEIGSNVSGGVYSLSTECISSASFSDNNTSSNNTIDEPRLPSSIETSFHSSSLVSSTPQNLGTSLRNPNTSSVVDAVATSPTSLSPSRGLKKTSISLGEGDNIVDAAASDLASFPSWRAS